MRKSNIRQELNKSPLHVGGEWEDRDFLDIYISPFESNKSKSKSMKSSIRKDNPRAKQSNNQE